MLKLPCQHKSSTGTLHYFTLGTRWHSNLHILHCLTPQSFHPRPNECAGSTCIGSNSIGSQQVGVSDFPWFSNFPMHQSLLSHLRCHLRCHLLSCLFHVSYVKKNVYPLWSQWYTYTKRITGFSTGTQLQKSGASSGNLKASCASCPIHEGTDI